MIWLSQHRDVQVLRWPDDASERLDSAAGPCLWLVAPDARPPDATSCLEDWTWLPASEVEIQARLAALVTRAANHPAPPALDEFGQLIYHGRSLYLSPTDELIVRALIDVFGEVVGDDQLLEAAWPDGGTPQALRVHISRLRRRLAPLGLALRCIRGAGYLMADATHACP